MLYAANRDRAACKLLKERIHGLEAQSDGRLGNDTRRLLMGDEYHRALFKKRNGKVDPPMDHEEGALIEDDDDPDLPLPLALSEDENKVELLTKAFDHLKDLGYADIPDYDLIQKCLEGFNEKETDPNFDDNSTKEDRSSRIPRIDWNLLSKAFKNVDSKNSVAKNSGMDDDDEEDPLDSSIFAEAETSITKGNSGEEEGTPLYGEAADMARLPLELRFRIAQMEYNTSHNTTIEPHLAMYDWLAACLSLLHNPWNSKKYERGGHRSNDDGYRRELFLKLVNKCLDCASKFGGFRETKVIYYDDDDDENDCDDKNTAGVNKNGTKERPTKRRRRQLSNIHEPTTTSGEKSQSLDNKGSSGDLLLISRVLFELRMVKKADEKLSPPPPIRLSFGL